MLVETLKRHWWVPVLRGIAAIVFGIIAFAYPGLTVAVLVVLFGAWVLVDGIITLLLGLMIYLQWPSSSAWAIGTLVGVSMIISGVTRVMLSLAVRKGAAAVG